MRKLILAAIAVAALCEVTLAQTYKADYATKLVLAGNMTSTANTLTLASPALSSGWTLTLPTAPAGTNGFVLTGNTDGTTSWASAGSLSVTLAGDVTGPSGSNTVAKINGVALGSTTATAGNLLIGDGAQWVSNAMSGDATINSSGVFTIGSNKVTYAKMQATSAPGVLIGSPSAGTAIGEITVGTGLNLSGTTLTASGFTGSLSGDVTGTQSATTINPANAGIGNRLVSGINTASTTINGDRINIDNTTLTTVSNVLQLNLANPNTWTGRQTLGAIAATASSPTTLAANTNDWALSTSNSYFKITSSTDVNVTGIASGVDGRVIVLANTGSNNIIFQSENAGSTTAADRFHFPGGSDIIVAPDGTLTLIYDSGISRWRFVNAN
jgi:hypothetical protein